MTEQDEIKNLKQQLTEHRDAVKAATSTLAAYGAVSTGDFLINVKRDFNAKGDQQTDDTVAIQNAISFAGDKGGKVIFPRGIYTTTNSLLMPGGTYGAIVLEGEGGMPGASGTTIVGSFFDWLIKNGWAETNFPQHAIINIAFAQNWQGEFGKDTNHTAGCINWGSGLGGYILGCNIDIWSGVGFYVPVDRHEIIGCNVTGHFGRSLSSDAATSNFNSVGFWSNGRVTGGKLTGCGTGVVLTDTGGIVENMMLDTCNMGLSIGNAPMAFERNPMENGPGVMWEAGWSSTSKSSHIRNVSMESSIIGCYVGRARSVFVEGCQIASYIQPPDGVTGNAGLMIDDSCDRSTFRGLEISGAYTAGGIVLGSQWGQGRATGTKFIDVNVNVTGGGGRNWSYKGNDINTRVLAADSTGQDPCVFESCAWLDDAINVSQLPSSPSSSWLQTVKDSIDPIWTGSASNAGKPVEGGGANRTTVRWDGKAWVLA